MRNDELIKLLGLVEYMTCLMFCNALLNTSGKLCETMIGLWHKS